MSKWYYCPIYGGQVVEETPCPVCGSDDHGTVKSFCDDCDEPMQEDYHLCEACDASRRTRMR